MLSIPGQARVFLAREAVDMRKSFDGLCNLVRHGFHLDPFEGDVFVFLNRRRNYVKLLVWDANGFWLCAKRLEVGTFEHWEMQPGAATHVEIDRARLAMLLAGIEMKKVKYRRHFAPSIRIGGSDDGERKLREGDDDHRCREAQ